jgi:hypothetical protein
VLAVTAGLLLTTTAAASAATVSATPSPYKSVHVFERHSGDLRPVSNAHVPHTHLPGFLSKTAVNSAAGTGTAVTPNWSGYADQACGTCALRFVAADFTVPHLNCAVSPDNSWAAYWVGLDGFSNNTVEQTGISASCSGGHDYYDAWYEMYPAATQVYSLAASPGDNIQVSVYTSNGSYYLDLQDTNLGAGVNTVATCPAGSSCQNKTAEVITETPYLPGTGYLPLADFGQVNYNNATVTSRSGTHGNLGTEPLWTGYAVKMAGGSGGKTTLAAPGGLRNGTNGNTPVSDFEVHWYNSN